MLTHDNIQSPFEFLLYIITDLNYEVKIWLSNYWKGFSCDIVFFIGVPFAFTPHHIIVCLLGYIGKSGGKWKFPT